MPEPSDPSPPPAERTPPARVLSSGFAKLFLGFFFTVVNANLFALLPYYLELRGASELLFGSVAGMTGFGGALSMVLLGGRADRLSRRRTIVRYLMAALAGNLLALGAMSLHPAWYLVVSGLHGVMLGVGLPVIFVWASELGPAESRTQAFAWLGIAGLIGDSLGPLLGEALLMTQPDPEAPAAFIVVFVAASAMWPLGLLCFSIAPDVDAPSDGGTDRGLLSLLRIPELRTALLGVAAFGGALGVMVGLGKNFVASIDLRFVSVLLGGHTVGALMTRLALPWLMRRFDRVALIPVAFFGVALSMGVLSVTRGNGLLALAGLIYGISHGVLFPTLLARLIDFGGTHAAGRISTLHMGMFSVGIGLMPAMGGVVLRVADFQTLFILVAMTCLGGLALGRRAERLHRLRLAAKGHGLAAAEERSYPPS